MVWDKILKQLFGKYCVANIEKLGHFIVLRQQRIYKTVGQKEGDLFNIYKSRCKELYDHDYFEEERKIANFNSSVAKLTLSQDSLYSPNDQDKDLDQYEARINQLRRERDMKKLCFERDRALDESWQFKKCLAWASNLMNCKENSTRSAYSQSTESDNSTAQNSKGQPRLSLPHIDFAPQSRSLLHILSSNN